MLNKTVACIIARTVSTRLPLKVLREIGNGMSMIDFIIARLKNVEEIDEIYICTSAEPVDDILEDVARKNAVKIYRGSANQVIERMLKVGEIENADVVLRVTGDNPFTSYEYINEQIQSLKQRNLDYVRLLSAPIGSTAEVIKYEALVACSKIMDPDESEYMMLYLFEPNKFRCGVFQALDFDTSKYSVTVDTQMDFDRARNLIHSHVNNGFDPLEIKLADIVKYYNANPEQFLGAMVQPSGMIKLPQGKEITYEAFNADMKRRVNDSILLKPNE
jgi:spore coat polysaccharide biosynthesis protein SpsF (cytidylyltransferase family)